MQDINEQVPPLDANEENDVPVVYRRTRWKTVQENDPNMLSPNSRGIRDSCSNDEAETLLNEQHIMRQLLQLKEEKLQIQSQILELEKQRVECMKFQGKLEDRETQEMKLETKAVKLENKRLALELKRREASFPRE